MDIIKLLEEAIGQSFKYYSVVEALGKQIAEIARVQVFKKYKDKKIFRNAIEYELYHAVSSMSFSPDDLSMPEVNIRLVYTVTSQTKLTRSQKDKLKRAKERFEESASY